MPRPEKTESQSQPKPVSEEKPGTKGSRDHAGTFLKVVAGLAIIAATFIGNKFQRKITAATLISQREQAESSLRADMFNSLLNSLVLPRREGTRPDDVRREQLLTELLALNFHEHFEFKPLLEFVDERLMQTNLTGFSASELEDARDSLRSVARRVVDRQLSLLLREEAPPYITIVVYKKRPPDKEPDMEDYVTLQTWDDLIVLSPQDRKPSEPFRVEKRRYQLTITPGNVDWENQTIDIEMLIEEARETTHDAITVVEGDEITEEVDTANRKATSSGVDLLETQLMNQMSDEQAETTGLEAPDQAPTNEAKAMGAEETKGWATSEASGGAEAANEHSRKFTLTSFDFPFTDNTLLGDGNRFSLVLYKVEKFEKPQEEISPKEESQDEMIDDVSFMELKLVWFPRGYYLPRERPIDQAEYHKLVGLKYEE